MSMSTQDLPRRYIQARAATEDEKRRILQQAQAEAMARAQASAAAYADEPRVNPPVPLPTRRIVSTPELVAPLPVSLPGRIKVDMGEPPPPPSNSLPTRNRVVASVSPPDDSADIPTYKPSRLASTPAPANAAEVLPTRRPRVVGAPSADPTATSTDALPTRKRRTQPRDMVADDAQYLSDLRTMPVEKMSRKKAALYGFLRGLASGNLVTGGVGAAVGALAPGATGNLARRDEIAKASSNLNTEMGREGDLAQIQATRELAAQRKNAPEVSRQQAEDKAKEQERDNLRQLYNAQPNFDPDTNPEHRNLRDRAAVLGMLLPRRDDKESFSLQWVNGQLKRVNTRTGAVSDIVEGGKPITDASRVPVVEDGLTVTPGQALNSRATRENRIYERGRDAKLDEKGLAETERKRQSYMTEGQDWLAKEKTFRANKEAEDRSIAAKEEKLAELYQEKPAGYFGGGRTTEQIKIDIARVQKDLEGHREKSGRFQTEADKAAGSATEARRNAGLYADSGGPTARGVIGRAPASDGKHHYTPAEIRKQAEASGVSYDALYNKLKGNKKVVIDQ